MLLEKRDIESLIDSNEKSLKELNSTLDNYSNLDNIKVTDEDLKFVISNFYKNYKATRVTKKLFQDLQTSLKVVSSNHLIIEMFIKEQLSEKSVGPVLSLKKGFAVAYVGNTEYALDYIIKLADYYVNKTLNETDVLTKDDVNYIENGIVKFANTMNDLALATDKFSKNFEELADIVVTDKNQDIIVSENTTVFKLNNFLGFRYNPIFFVGKIMGNLTANKYKARKEKIRYLNLRLNHLENVNRDLFNPQLEKEINMLRERIERMESDNREIERNVGGV